MGKPRSLETGKLVLIIQNSNCIAIKRRQFVTDRRGIKVFQYTVPTILFIRAIQLTRRTLYRLTINEQVSYTIYNSRKGVQILIIFDLL